MARERNGLSICDLALELSRLQHLSSLVLGDTECLGLDANWPPYMYHCPGQHGLGSRVPDTQLGDLWQNEEAEELVARNLIYRCPMLQELWVGGKSQAIVTRIKEIRSRLGCGIGVKRGRRCFGLLTFRPIDYLIGPHEVVESGTQ